MRNKIIIFLTVVCGFGLINLGYKLHHISQIGLVCDVVGGCAFASVFWFLIQPIQKEEYEFGEDLK